MLVLVAVAAAAMGGFLGYHMWLLRVGMTTNETVKWRNLRLALGEQLYGGPDDDIAADGNATTSSGGKRGGDDRHRDSKEGGRCGCAPEVESGRSIMAPPGSDLKLRLPPVRNAASRVRC